MPANFHPGGPAPREDLNLGVRIWITLLAPVVVIEAFVPRLTLTAVIGALCVAGFIAFSVRLYLASRTNSVDYAVVAFILIVAFSCLTSTYRPNSIVVFTSLLASGALYVIIRSIPEEVAHGFHATFAAWAIVFCILSVLHFEHAYRQWLQLGFSDVIAFRRQLALIPEISTPGTPNLAFVAINGLTLIGLAVQRRSRHWYFAWLSGAAFLLNALCLYLTFSRTVYLSVAAYTLASLLLIRPRPTRKTLIWCTLVLLAGLTALGSVGLLKPAINTARISATASQRRSIEGRTHILGAAAGLAGPHILLGVGPGNFAMTFDSINRGAGLEFVAHPFNWFLQTFIEMGVVGLLAGLNLFLFPLWSFRKLFLRTDDRVRIALVISAIISVFLYNLFESSLFSSLLVGGLSMTVLAIAANRIDAADHDAQPV